MKQIIVSSLEELRAYIEDKDWNITDCSFGNDSYGWEISLLLTTVVLKRL